MASSPHRFHLIFSLLAIAGFVIVGPLDLLLSATPLSGTESPDATPAVLVFGAVRLHLLSADTLRVTEFSSAGLEKNKKSRAIHNSWPYSPPPYNVSKSAQGLTRIETSRMMVELDAKSPDRIAFYRRANENELSHKRAVIAVCVCARGWLSVSTPTPVPNANPIPHVNPYP